MIMHGLIFFYGYTKLKSSSNDLRNESWSLKNCHYFWSIESQMETVVLHGRSALGELPPRSHSVRMSIHVCEAPDWWPAVAHSCLRQIPGAVTAMSRSCSIMWTGSRSMIGAGPSMPMERLTGLAGPLGRAARPSPCNSIILSRCSW